MIILGPKSEHESVALEAAERRRHLYIVGQTGTGKSTLLLNLLAQDLSAGEGMALLDPHGDLAEAALAAIPNRHRGDEVHGAHICTARRSPRCQAQ